MFLFHSASLPAARVPLAAVCPRFARLRPLALGFLLLAVAVAPVFGAGGEDVAGDSVWTLVAADQRAFYSGDGLLTLAAGVAAAGLLANTAMDTEVRDFYQDKLRSPGTDRASDAFRLDGDVRVVLPLYLSGFLVGKAWPESAVGAACGQWGERALRAFMLGAPPVLVLENLLGSSRPEDGGDAGWHPFRGGAGVSGHAFLGAVTFLSAARMAESAAGKGLLVAASVLSGLSRINDDEHYLSQVTLGWLIGYLAVAAVDVAPAGMVALSVLPGLVGGRPGVTLTRAF